MRLALVGFMGAGKTMTGRLVAQAAGLPFVDLDQRIEDLAGRTVPQLFADGEPRFRRLERSALLELLERDELVLATGGGAPCTPGSMDALLEWGTVVFLDVPLDVLRQRVTGEGRPLWSDGVAALLAERQPVYRRGRVVDGVGDPEVVAARVLEVLCA
ncbi:MAG: shikimate kinase [Proteobacteria bacterium]|nr:shikimate kinase [Pseudomonadota bacterium]MCP4915349.1 shikimate kinase [Pseudomonadota bacterium]